MRGFTILSPIYDILASIGSFGLIHKSQIYFIRHTTMPPGGHVLVAGGGTGKFLVELIRQVNPSKVTYIDMSEGMIRQAKKKLRNLKHATAVEYIQADILTCEIPAQFDMIVTNYFLDLFDEDGVNRIIAKLKASLKEKGWWLVTDFSTIASSTGMKRFFISASHRVLYGFFRLFCGIRGNKILDYDKILGQHQMHCYIYKKFGGMVYSALYRRAIE